jgi:thiol:disulfide interchange protein DsbD
MRRTVRLLSLVVVLSLLAIRGLAGPSPEPAAAADTFDPAKAVPVEARLSPNQVAPGARARLAVVFHVPKGYHITDRKYEMFYVEADTTARLRLDSLRYPAGTPEKEEHVYRGDVTVTGVVDLQPGPTGELEWTVRVGYQICSETGNLTCYMPVDKELRVKVPVVDAVSATSPVVTQSDSRATLDAAPATVAAGGLEGRLQAALAARSWMAFLLVFLGGILSSLTPCVYPVIPITISFIGGRSKGKLHGFLQSLFFVAGMVLVYSTLGVAAALGGGSFGAIGQSAAVQATLAVVFLVFAASMFGAFEMQLPPSIADRLPTGHKSGPLGAILMGALMGFIAAPCVGPIIAALLVFIASTQSLALGFFLMLAYALGMGVLFLLIGTFAGALNSLPRSGSWMVTVKKFFGVVMVAMAVYFLRSVIPGAWMPWLAGAGLVVFGVFSGAFHPLTEESGSGEKFYKALGWVALLIGARFLLFGFGGPAGIAGTAATVGREELAWQLSSPETDRHQELLARAAAEGRPAVVDFWATWCAQCRELDEKTWTDAALIQEAQRFQRVKMDMTKSETPWAKAQNSAFRVVGMPTVIFYDSQGSEVRRFVGFRRPEEVLEMMRSVQ